MAVGAVAMIGVVALVVLPGLSASAALTTGYATWGALTGASTAYTGSMRLPAPFPAATLTSNSRSGQVGVQTGASTWLGPTTPFGQRFGSSQGSSYLNLRPRADTAAGASTTTYTFARPTPLGWGFALGDIDADQVTVTATRADGGAASAADLGFQSVFNFCSVTPRPTACGGTPGTDVPTWDPAQLTLVGNPGSEDTTGATGWFEPTTPLRTLTFTFQRRSGIPVYQTWFALRMQDITGTVTGDCDRTDLRVDLLDDEGALLESTTPDAGGAFSFTGLAASDGYHVRIGQLPRACEAVGPTNRAVDLTDGDGVVTFAVQPLPTATVSGTVTDEEGQPLDDVTVRLDPGTDDPMSTTTGSDGGYVFEDVLPGTHTIVVVPPAGFDAAPPLTIVTGTQDVTAPDISLAPAAPAPPAPVTPPATAPAAAAPILPATGFNGPLAGLGLGLLACGALCHTARRRSRRT